MRPGVTAALDSRCCHLQLGERYEATVTATSGSGLVGSASSPPVLVVAAGGGVSSSSVAIIAAACIVVSSVLVALVTCYVVRMRCASGCLQSHQLIQCKVLLSPSCGGVAHGDLPCIPVSHHGAPAQYVLLHAPSLACDLRMTCRPALPCCVDCV